MTIARLTENLKLDTGDRFIVFYGHVNDVYCDDDLSFDNIDQMLWRYFHAQGYQRIVFYDGAKKLYFLDAESDRLCRTGQTVATQTQQNKINNAPSGLRKGPLGGLKLVGSTSTPTPVTVYPTQTPDPSLPQQRRMSDLGAIETINHIISHERSYIPTVVVFTHADDLTPAHFEGRAFREFQNRLVTWARGGGIKPNLCAFIFQQNSRQDLLELCKHHELTALENCINIKGEEGQNVLRAGGPEQQELLNAIHHERLTNRMAVDWPRLERLAAWVAMEDQTLSFWRSKLSGVKEFSRESVRSLLPGGRTYSDKTAEEQLNEMIGLKSVKEQLRKKLAVARQLG
ncbi:MAG: hypothetical protein PHI31_15350, partial [Desulfuromonadaceae bacterium]|nr:hypothetical protein [Desulfuromonadaceae bacterium]